MKHIAPKLCGTNLPLQETAPFPLLQGMSPKLQGRAASKLPKEDVAEAIQQYGKPSSSLDGKESAQSQQLAVMLRASMVAKCVRFIKARGEYPLMQFYSSDGTPMKVHFKVAKTVGGAKVRRERKFGK